VKYLKLLIRIPLLLIALPVMTIAFLGLAINWAFDYEENVKDFGDFCAVYFNLWKPS